MGRGYGRDDQRIAGVKSKTGLRIRCRESGECLGHFKNSPDNSCGSFLAC